ncbi:MAG: type II secretion system protein [Phycisphaerae bacterium]|nr:type II secretion system protein [Phycisphaerae bacterium]
MNFRQRRSVRGFTLIELLVVVAIIAVLISILLPSLRGARDQAKQVQCGAGLRSFGIGFLAYAADNNSYVCSGAFDPEVSNGRDGPVDKVGWVADLVNAKLAFPNQQRCPSNVAQYNQKLAPGAAGSNSYTEAQVRDLVARGYNSNYTQFWFMARSEVNPNASSSFNWRRVNTCMGPYRAGRYPRVADSTVPLLGDGRTDLDGGRYEDMVLGEPSVKTMTDGPYSGPYDIQNFADIGPAHGFGSRLPNKPHARLRANVLFADGHVSVFVDKVRNGEFRVNDATDPVDQEDIDSMEVFDGVLSLGRRSSDAFMPR